VNVGGSNELQIEALERRIAYQQKIIKDAETVLDQLDQAVTTLIQYDRIRGPQGSIAVRESQKEERASLNQQVIAAYSTIEDIQTELMPLQKEYLSLQAEVGPLKYIAELIYGNEAEDHFDSAVRWIIMLIVLVFDPLAILLVISANMTFMQRRGESISFVESKDLTQDTPDYGMEMTETDEVELSTAEVDQFRRLDKGLRKKLGWLIDKGTSDG
jgi:uncharacterized coiled-coil protein SlyX